MGCSGIPSTRQRAKAHYSEHKDTELQTPKQNQGKKARLNPEAETVGLMRAKNLQPWTLKRGTPRAHGGAAGVAPTCKMPLLLTFRLQGFWILRYWGLGYSNALDSLGNKVSLAKR